MLGNKWELFHKGMIRPDWIRKEDGQVLEWSDESGLCLHVFYKSPTFGEVADFSAGSTFAVKFTEVDKVGFFSIKFGRQNWAECPFSPNLYAEKPKFEMPDDRKAYALHVFLIDSQKGELMVIRSIALGREFSLKFREWCLKSLADYEVTGPYYNQIVNETFIRYPQGQLAREALFGWDKSNYDRSEKERGERTKDEEN